MLLTEPLLTPISVLNLNRLTLKWLLYLRVLLYLTTIGTGLASKRSTAVLINRLRHSDEIFVTQQAGFVAMYPLSQLWRCHSGTEWQRPRHPSLYLDCGFCYSHVTRDGGISGLVIWYRRVSCSCQCSYERITESLRKLKSSRRVRMNLQTKFETVLNHNVDSLSVHAFHSDITQSLTMMVITICSIRLWHGNCKLKFHWKMKCE